MAAAHGEHEARTGQADENWPARYARYLVAGQAGTDIPEDRAHAKETDMMNGTTVAVVTSRTEAELIVGLLRSHGLRAGFAADDAGGQEPQLQLSGGVPVMVDPADEAAARKILDALP